MTYEKFTEDMLRKMAAAYGVSYEHMTSEMAERAANSVVRFRDRVMFLRASADEPYSHSDLQGSPLYQQLLGRAQSKPIVIDDAEMDVDFDALKIMLSQRVQKLPITQTASRPNSFPLGDTFPEWYERCMLNFRIAQDFNSFPNQKQPTMAQDKLEVRNNIKRLEKEIQELEDKKARVDLSIMAVERGQPGVTIRGIHGGMPDYQFEGITQEAILKIEKEAIENLQRKKSKEIDSLLK